MRQLETAQDKYQLIKDSKDREIKDLTRKLTDTSKKLTLQMEKYAEIENRFSNERDSFN